MMKSPHTRKFVLSAFLFAVLVFTFTALYGHAQNYPDINDINPTLYLSANQQFFQRPGGGYALVSTNLNGKTMLSLLNNDGELDFRVGRKPITFNFTYKKATPYENFLYLTGWSSELDNSVAIKQIQLDTGKHLLNSIANTSCDFERDFNVNEHGLWLVTAPVGTAVDPLTPPSLYRFNAELDGDIITAQPFPPASSASGESSGGVSSAISSTAVPGTSSGASSSSASPVSSAPSTPSATSSGTAGTSSSSQPDNSPTFHFDAPVTVEALQKELAQAAPNQKLRVLNHNSRELKTGNIGTGCTIETLTDGKTDTRYIAVIPGDLDGNGIVTEDDCAILYRYFTKPAPLKAAVLNGAYYEAALLCANDSVHFNQKELETGDLLKIKKLIKK